MVVEGDPLAPSTAYDGDETSFFFKEIESEFGTVKITFNFMSCLVDDVEIIHSSAGHEDRYTITGATVEFYQDGVLTMAVTADDPIDEENKTWKKSVSVDANTLVIQRSGALKLNEVRVFVDYKKDNMAGNYFLRLG